MYARQARGRAGGNIYFFHMASRGGQSSFALFIPETHAWGPAARTTGAEKSNLPAKRSSGVGAKKKKKTAIATGELVGVV